MAEALLKPRPLPKSQSNFYLKPTLLNLSRLLYALFMSERSWYGLVAAFKTVIDSNNTKNFFHIKKSSLLLANIYTKSYLDMLLSNFEPHFQKTL